MESYIVYKHTSPSGKVYVGITKQTPNGRWKNGIGYKSSPHFLSAIQKYGWENMKHEIIFSGLTKEDACEKEQELIALLKATDRRYGYNERAGGEIGAFHSEAVRKKISESILRYFREHPEAKENLSRKHSGYKHTDEAKAKMSAAAKVRHYVLTEDWKKKIGESNRKTLMENETLYNDHVKRCRENGARAAKRVVQLDLDGTLVAEYSSAHEAERKTGIRNGNISRCCNGKLKTSGGYKWQYANLYNGSSETALPKTQTA